MATIGRGAWAGGSADRLREVRAIINLEWEKERIEAYEPLMDENGYSV